MTLLSDFVVCRLTSVVVIPIDELSFETRSSNFSEECSIHFEGNLIVKSTLCGFIFGGMNTTDMIPIEKKQRSATE